MSAEAICDGCGKRAKMWSNGSSWFKPGEWFERSDDEGTQTACSRECIQRVATTSGKTSVVLPI